MVRRLTSIALGLLLGLAGCGKDARGCAETGGTVVTLQCCASAPDFPSTCVAGACGCAPEVSAPRSACQCPAGRCFDGTSCR
jgi:hypothetical protein